MKKRLSANFKHSLPGKRKLLFIIFLFGVMCARAQGGGPPMLTDDPGVVDLHSWEINTSINTTLTSTAEIAFPYVDANYGIARNLQLKVESPYVFTMSHSHVNSTLGEIEFGLKYQFLNEQKHFISLGTYPQWVVRGDKGFLLPLLIQKTFGKFLVGEDLGFFFGQKRNNNLQNGSLAGLQASKKLQLMAEYFIQRNYHNGAGTEGYLNIGFRQTLSKVITLMGSFGTQLSTSPGEERTCFISFLGIQSDFK
jgi:hypothetical protein